MAREAIRTLEGQVPADMVEDATLLVSELVTNSVKYGTEGELTLQIEAREPRRLRVEVINHGASFEPKARTRPKTEAGGWGLHLVETLADEWGVHEGSTHVWFELRRA